MDRGYSWGTDKRYGWAGGGRAGEKEASYPQISQISPAFRITCWRNYVLY
jgi:hypothetical protein